MDRNGMVRGILGGCARLLSVLLCSYPFPLEPLVSVAIPLCMSGGLGRGRGLADTGGLCKPEH